MFEFGLTEVLGGAVRVRVTWKANLITKVGLKGEFLFLFLFIYKLLSF